MKWITRIVILAALAGMGMAGYLLFVGPHMISQPHVRAYEPPMLAPPPGVEPVASSAALPQPVPDETAVSPLPPTQRNIAAGKVYYQYYACLACHGADGRGDGPVGESFVPKPTDLTDAKYRRYSDGQLLQAILNSPGHKPLISGADRMPPVFEYTILPRHRWYVVLYTRSLAGMPASAPAAAATAPAPQ